MIKKIKELVETETGLQDIGIKKRTQQYVEARVLYSNLALKHTKLSCKRIGEEINRDHSSVVHHKKVFTQWIQLKKFYAQNLNSYKTLESMLEEEKVVDTNAIDLYRKYKRESKILLKQNKELLKKLELKQKEIDRLKKYEPIW
ncbi:ATPase involved in DNA replication initiation (DnaA) [uncultured Mediterranean phage uvMED]|nr:ATPase involved in DNA replication initiation (DnaA) [uncultured Mediterranean phage uvMED]